MLPDASVAIVRTQTDADALSARYDHDVRVDAVAGRLVYVHVPEPGGEPAHVATLRGAALVRGLELLGRRREAFGAGGRGRGPPPPSNTTKAQQGVVDLDIDVDWSCGWNFCLSSNECGDRPDCGSCFLFWCA